MTQSVAQFAARMTKAPEILRAAEKRSVEAATLAVTTAVRVELSTAMHGNTKLRGVGKNGATVSVRYDIKGSPPAGLVRMVGPAQLIENKTKPHTILPRGVGRAQGRSKVARHAAKQSLYDALFGGGGFSGVKPLALPSGPRFAVRHHPGTEGKHPWAKGVAAGIPAGGDAFDATVGAAIVKVVRG